MPSEHMQAMLTQQQKLLKLMQDKPELLENINDFVQLLKDNGVFEFCFSSLRMKQFSLTA